MPIAMLADALLGLTLWLLWRRNVRLGRERFIRDYVLPKGLRRCWHWRCREENIDSRQPSRLPLLFALDAKFGIADGYVYTPDCKALAGTVHCGADLGGGGD